MSESRAKFREATTIEDTPHFRGYLSDLLGAHVTISQVVLEVRDQLLKPSVHTGR
jgi:hypothetical protein